MTDLTAETRRARAAAEAAQWAERLESDHMAAAEREEFVNWLRESPVHVAESLRMLQLSAILKDFHSWSAVPTSELTASENVVRLNTKGRAGGTEATSHVRGWWRIAAAVVGISLTIASGLLLKERLAATQLHTIAGERREITLKDGSILRLAPNTDLKVELRRSLRLVNLQRGQATFRVAKDPSRPFVVSAARASVQAVGTVFAVARNADNVVVTVTEGRVAVTSRSADLRRGSGELSGTWIPLSANERVSISPSGITSQVRHVATAHTSDWEDSQLVFENTRVSDVIEKFNQRNDTQIRLSDASLGARTVSGVFAGDDPRSFVEFLTTASGSFRAEAGPDEIVVLPRVVESNVDSPRR